MANGVSRFSRLFPAQVNAEPLALTMVPTARPGEMLPPFNAAIVVTISSYRLSMSAVIFSRTGSLNLSFVIGSANGSSSLVTNYHVVEGASRVSVVRKGGSSSSSDGSLDASVSQPSVVRMRFSLSKRLDSLDSAPRP